MDSHETFGQWISNAIGGGVVLASWAGLLPSIMTVLGTSVALIWYSIQISESETVRRWRVHRRERKIAKLRATLLLLEAPGHVAPPPPKT